MPRERRGQGHAGDRTPGRTESSQLLAPVAARGSVIADPGRPSRLCHIVFPIHPQAPATIGRNDLVRWPSGRTGPCGEDAFVPGCVYRIPILYTERDLPDTRSASKVGHGSRPVGPGQRGPQRWLIAAVSQALAGRHGHAGRDIGGVEQVPDRRGQQPGRCGGTSRPVSPGTTRSDTALTVVAMTGTPQIMASTTTVGRPSYRLGRAKMSNAGSTSSTSVRSPARTTRALRRRLARRRPARRARRHPPRHR